MEREIIKFYEDKGLHIPKLIQKAPKTIPKGAIEAAAIEVYWEVQNGLIIKDLSIRSRIFRKAKDVDAGKYLKRIEGLEDAEFYQKELKTYQIMFYSYVSISLILAIIFGASVWFH